jgi:hypothetical protein
MLGGAMSGGHAAAVALPEQLLPHLALVSTNCGCVYRSAWVPSASSRWPVKVSCDGGAMMGRGWGLHSAQRLLCNKHTRQQAGP